MEPAAPSPAARPTSPWGERRALTIGLLLVVTLAAFEALAVATVLPSAQRDLGGVRLYGWAFSAFLLASLVGIVWAGTQCDSRGPAAPFAAGATLFGVGLAIAGLAPAMWVLVAGRAVQGLGAGVIPAVAYVSIGRGYDEAARPRMFALMSTAWVVPGLAGPGIAAAVAEVSSWRLVFLGLLPFILFSAWLTLPALRSLGAPAVPTASNGRVRMAIVLAAGAALMLGGFTAPSPIAAVPLVIGGALTTIFAILRLAPRGSLRLRRGLPAAIAGMCVLNFAFFGADAFIPFALTTIRGEPTYVAGIVLTLATLGWSSGSWLVDRNVAKVPRERLMVSGMVLIAAGVAGQVAILESSVPVAVSAVAWTVGAFGMGMAYPCFSLSVLAQAPAGQEGEIGSSVKLAESLGGAFGTGVAGAIVAAGSAASHQSAGAATAFVLTAVAALAGIFVAVRTRR
ncbi:MAG: MFS transporter [Chloroflexi bacterium]|nr:MFS transporter [Chloroflexota bacterium]